MHFLSTSGLQKRFQTALHIEKATPLSPSEKKALHSPLKLPEVHCKQTDATRIARSSCEERPLECA
eukprot:5694349-Amphidinium_carterae.1